jgi:hypothetical protein
MAGACILNIKAILGHVTYTSKQRRLTTKKSIQPTIVVTYTSALLCFERAFYQKLATQQQVSERTRPQLQ